MNNVRIHHIAITAPAEVLARVVSFYDQVLGLKPGFRPDFFGLKGEWLYSGEEPIIHLLEDPGRNGEKSGYFDHFALRCDNLAEIHKNLENNQIEYQQLESPEVNQFQLFIQDPAGNTVELNFEV